MDDHDGLGAEDAPAERKRVQWLISWKTQLISDLNTGRYRASIRTSPVLRMKA